MVRLRPHSVSSGCTDTQFDWRSEEHTSELQSRSDLVCRLLLEKKKDGESIPTSPETPQYLLHAVAATGNHIRRIRRHERCPSVVQTILSSAVPYLPWQVSGLQ